MSGLFKSTIIKGTKITDFAQTSASVGNPIPFGYGRFNTDGNIVFASLPPKEHRTLKRQGKGGVKQETFAYTLDYAVGFCSGPIYGWWWIKRNGKVVWTNDPAAPIEDAAYAAKWLEKVTFYYGTSSQLPDSTIEAHEGTGRVSAFKYIAYIVVENDDVTDGGGAIPSYEAVPMASPPEMWLTSHPYAQKVDDLVKSSLVPTGGALTLLVYESELEPDQSEHGLIPSGGEMFEVPPPEVSDEAEMELVPTGGQLFTPPPQYWYDATEPGLVPASGKLAIPPLGTVDPDEVEPTLTPTGGALYVP